MLRKLMTEYCKENGIVLPSKRDRKMAAKGNVLIFCVYQDESQTSYPHLEQQQRILSRYVERVNESFPLQRGERFIDATRPNCGAEYQFVRLVGDQPTAEQLEYLRRESVDSYEVISFSLYQERAALKYYFWDHDRSSEISLQEAANV